MKPWYVALTEHFKTNIWEGLSETALFWGKGFLFLTLIGSVIWWFTSRRDKSPRSFRALVRYLYPKEYYAHPTMRPAYWNLLWGIFIFGPLLTLLGGATFGESVARYLVANVGHRDLLLHTDWVIALVQIFMMWWVFSFFGYWIHRAMHRVPLLWSIHRVHHSSEALGITALAHTHPLENVLVSSSIIPTGILSGLMLYLMGMDDFHPIAKVAFAFYGTWEVAHGIFEHSHVRISFGWFNRIYAGAMLHQIHHSAELRHRDKNLGNHFAVIWDWIFGTLYLPEKNEQYRWGLNDEEYGPTNPHLTLRDFYLEPFCYAWGVLRNRRQQHPPQINPVS